MVGPAEAPITVAALEGLGAGVLPVVTGQLVTARETPFTAFPRTSIWFLA